MRIGSNPSIGKELRDYPRLVVSAIVHLPHMSGYHAHRLDVVKTSLRLMVERMNRDAFVQIWDNGSCAEMRRWLENEFKPDMLIQSRNVGKQNARTAIFGMWPADTVIACADDDIFYYPDWLNPQLELLNHFPNVGVVSGYPCRTSFRWGNKKTIAWARKNAEVRTGRFLPDEWERDFAISIGRDPEMHMGDYTAKDVDTIIKYRGREAYATSHHCQFVGVAGKVLPCTKFVNRLMGSESNFDVAIDDAGLLRLCTTERLTRHIGNVLDNKFVEKIKEYAYA